MIVLIDIGNTRTKWQHATDEMNNVVDREITKIENTALTDDYYNKHWSTAKKVILASVNSGTLTTMISAWCAENHIVFKLVETEANKYGVQCGYHTPENLGVDRWLALVGVRHLFPNKNVLVVDAGTATTIDLIDAGGQHRGGWILPGIDLLYSSIINNTSKVIANKSSEKSISFGDDSKPCVNNGIWAMTIGAIKQGIIEAEAKKKLDVIVMCGGNGAALASLISNPQLVVIEQLLFNGLQQYIND